LPAGYTLVANLGATTLAPGQSTSFTIQLDAAAAGSPGGVIHLVSNDADEGSFDLTLTATVTDPVPPPPPPPTDVTKTIDNGAAGFTTTGRWHLLKNKGGYERDIQFAEKVGKNDRKLATATWTFGELPPGQYRVSVSFPKSPSYAKDAPFTVLEGATVLCSVLVNQKGPPARRHGRDSVYVWQELGTFTVQGSTLVVQLTNRAHGHVVADAVRVERVATAEDLLLLAPSEPAPASTPQQQTDIALEQTLLDSTNQLLDELAGDLARQETTSTTSY
jgi:hypothetical protein